MSAPAAPGTVTRIITWSTVMAAFFLVLMGLYVQVSGSGLACPDWPTCYGDWMPPTNDAHLLTAWAYRVATGIVSLLVGVLAIHTWLGRGVGGPAVFYATLALSLALLHGVTSGLTVLLAEPTLLVTLTHGLGLLLFGVLLYVLFLTLHPTVNPVTAEGAVVANDGATPFAAFLTRIEPYLEVSKPGILYLLLVAGGAAAFVAAPVNFPWGLATLSLVGGGLAHVSAAAFNCYLERDLDAQMRRTAQRPLPQATLPARNVLIYAIVVGVASVGLLAAFVNLLAAGLALGAIFYYVVVYTLLLKPRTPQNIVIGGFAGSFACLVAWAGVTGEVSLVPLAMGFLIFVWTPPHFWALALVYKDDYAKAGFPMMPVVKGVHRTKVEILVYTVLMVATSLALVWPLGAVGWVYGVPALALGVVAGWLAWRLYQADDGQLVKPGYRLFWYSIVYLGVLFILMVVDRIALT